MLAKYYRLRMRWVGDQTLTYDSGARINIQFVKWKAPAGVLEWSAQVTEDLGFSAGETIVTTGQVEQATPTDNTTDKYWGVQGTFKMTADANSTDGVAYLYVEYSDDNSLWPSDMADFDCDIDLRCIATLVFSTDAEDETRAVNFEF
jgi:hypothetical protein